jgi:hypothetical protein
MPEDGMGCLELENERGFAEVRFALQNERRMRVVPKNSNDAFNPPISWPEMRRMVPFRFLASVLVDKPEAARCNRVSEGGKPGAPRATRRASDQVTNGKRIRLAKNAKGIGRKALGDIATLVTPETLLAWHRKLIVQKCDGSAKRSPGRPRVTDEIRKLIVEVAVQNRS